MAIANRQTGMDEPPLKDGAIFGAVSFIVGYIITLVLLVIAESDEITDNLIEGAGWIYYNAQFAPVEWEFEGDGAEFFEEFDTSFNYLTGDEADLLSLPSVVYHLVPIIVLIAAGYLVAKRANAIEPKDGAIAGATLALGTVVLALIGVFVFTASEEGATLAPALFESIILVGILFPVIFGAIGGILQTKL